MKKNHLRKAYLVFAVKLPIVNCFLYNLCTFIVILIKIK